MFCGFGGSKSRFAQAAGAETSGQMRDEKLDAIVARSTFGSQECLKLRDLFVFEVSDVVLPKVGN